MITHSLASQNTTPPSNLQTILATLSSLSTDDLQSVHSFSLWEMMDRDFQIERNPDMIALGAK